PEVHAITDITGFGLLGHGLELARGAGLTFVIDGDGIPLLPRAEALAREGFVTGASHRNWASFGGQVSLPENLPDWRRHILTDPQTSGGLLVTCAPARAEAILGQCHAAGFAQAAVVGRFEAGPAAIRVEA
ncbi:MAG: selenide, water dikinase SelD, partial [Parafilimonas terrae]|nr:selenide, water dikinase SelD [Parafilimonas terrae]